MNVNRWTRSIDPSRTAILLCDMQGKFRTKIRHFEHVAKMSKKLLKVANTLNISVLSTEQNPQGLGTTIESLKGHCNKIYPKMKFSMLIPEIETGLTQAKITTVGLIGIETHVCILQTCLDLLNLDMNVYVMSDAVSSCNLEERKTALKSISDAGGMVTTTESFVYRLLKDASSPHAKEVFGIVKEFSQETKDAVRALC